MWFLVAQSTFLDPTTWVTVIGSLGFPVVMSGAFGWAILTDRIPRRSEVVDLRADKQALQNELDQLRSQYSTQVLPALQETILTIREVASGAREQRTISEKVVEKLDQFSDTGRRLEIELAKRG